MTDELELVPDYGVVIREETGTSQEAVGTPKAENVGEMLKDVADPELGINVVDLDLIYDIALEGADVVIDITLTPPACSLTDAIEGQTMRALEEMAGSTRINWVRLLPWGPERTTSDGRETFQALGFNA